MKIVPVRRRKGAKEAPAAAVERVLAPQELQPQDRRLALSLRRVLVRLFRGVCFCVYLQIGEASLFFGARLAFRS